MEYLLDYASFLAKAATIVIAILLVMAGIICLASRGHKDKGKIKINHLNEHLDDVKKQIQEMTLSKHHFKKVLKDEKKSLKVLSKKEKPRLFVIHFEGDIRATEVAKLKEEINAILTVATSEDEVVVCLESGGGLMHAYGLGASQLRRFREHNIPLVVIVDKVAASGGYLMASVANLIIAAPFAIIGSIGVLAQLPNFHRLLKDHKIDFEQHHAGEFKRTISLFGENTAGARKKLQEELEEAHYFFKDFIYQNRPQLDVNKVATGEHWIGTRAYELNLIDKVGTSDDYLIKAANEREIYCVSYVQKKNLSDKLSMVAQMSIQKLFSVWREENEKSQWR